MKKMILCLACLMMLHSCKKSDEESTDIHNTDLYEEAILESTMGIWERNESSVGKFVYAIYGESKYIYIDAIFIPIDEEGFYKTQYMSVNVDTKNQCLVYEAEKALWNYTKESPKRSFKESMPGYLDGIVKSVSSNELSIDGRSFTRVTKKFNVSDAQGDWIRYENKKYYISFKSGQVETNYEDSNNFGPGISKGMYSVDQNEKHSYTWARQYDLGGINIAIDYTEYWSYNHASFFILTDYLGCYNGDYYFYKPTH